MSPVLWHFGDITKSRIDFRLPSPSLVTGVEAGRPAFNYLFLWIIGHDQPIRHSGLEMFEHGRFTYRH
jgi:hypothetical protein